MSTNEISAREFFTNNEVLWYPFEMRVAPMEPAELCYGEPKYSKELVPVASKVERVFNEKKQEYTYKVKDNSGHRLYKHEKTTQDGKTYSSYKPEQNDFVDFTPQQIIERQNLLTVPQWKKRFNYIAVDTRRFKHIDLDCPEYEQVYKDLLQTHPYYKSSTKSFGKHILFTCDKKPPKNRCDLRNEGFPLNAASRPDLELLSGQWSYCPIDAVIYNADCKDPTFDFEPYLFKKSKITNQPKLMPLVNEIISTPSTPSTPKTPIATDLISQHRELLDLIRMPEKGNRDLWMGICDVIKSIGLKNEDWIHFCIRNNFNKGNPDKEKRELFEKCRGDKSIFLLHRYAKQCNYEKHAEYLKKYNITLLSPEYQQYLDDAEKLGALDSNELRQTTKYIKMKSLFEKTHFKLEQPIRYVRLNDRNDIQFYTAHEMTEYLLGKQGYGTVGGEPFFELWREDEQKRVFTEIVFEPNLAKHLPTNYNSFTGFMNNDPSAGKIVETESKFFEVLRRITVKPEIYEYMKSWFAHIIQKPYKKTNVAVVFYSDTKGVGKNCIVDGFTAIIGEQYFAVLNDIEDLARNFNAHLTNKLFIYGDEISFNAKKLSDKLKKVITQPYQNLEKKTVDVIKVADKSNYFFTTNNEHSFKMEKGDRRLYMVNCLEEKLSKELSTAFYAEIEDPVKLKQLFNFFMDYKQEVKEGEESHDIGISAPPQTAYKKNLQFADLPAYIEVLYKNPSLFKNQKINSTDLYDIAVKYAKENHQSTNFTMTKFGSEMTKYLGNIKKKGKTCNYFAFGSTIEIREMLFKVNPEYYRYVYQLDESETPTFTAGADSDSDQEFGILDF